MRLAEASALDVELLYFSLLNVDALLPIDGKTMRFPRPRFTMRAVLVAMTATALVICFVVSPVYRTLEARRGSQRLLAVGAKLEHSIYLKRDYNPPLYPPATSSETLPAWLAPLAGDAAKMRADAEVLEIYAHDDAQVQALCDHGERFPQLQVIDLWHSSISPYQVVRFQASLAKFPRALDFHFCCPIPPGLLASLGQARSIFLWNSASSRAPFGGVRAKELAAIDNLHLLWIKGYALRFDDAIHLARCKNLRRLYLQDTGLSDADWARLKKAMPQCEIAERHPVELNQPVPLPPGSNASFDGLVW